MAAWRSNWPRREQWPYDIWPNFKPLFDLAAEQGFPVVAIDADYQLPLPERDRLAANIIAKAAHRHPEATVIVSTGQMHVAPPHLPAKVDLAFIAAGLSSPERVIVYQNAEEIYWQLAAEGREEVEGVQVAPGEYCVNNTPPLVQQLSYLHWVRFDEELIEFTQLEATVQSLIKDLAEYLDLEIGDAAERVRVLKPGDLELLDALPQEQRRVDLQRRRRQPPADLARRHRTRGRRGTVQGWSLALRLQRMPNRDAGSHPLTPREPHCPI